MKKCFTKLVASCAITGAFLMPAEAQWQTPNHSVPVGRGGGTGFGSVALGANEALIGVSGQNPVSRTFSAWMDLVVGSTQYTVAQRGAATWGAVVSPVCGANNWLTSIGACAQPAFSNLSGSISAGQIANSTITNAMLNGLTAWTNGAAGAIGYTGGSVGIGTTGPTTQLDATGTVRFRNYAGPNCLSVDADGNLGTSGCAAGAPGGSSGTVQFYAGPSTFGGDTGLFWDNTSKRLGIGTASPAYPLSLNSGASGDPMAAFFASTVADGTGVSVFLGKSAAAGGTGIFKMTPNVATPASSRMDLGIYGDDLSTQGLSILKGGNVGIGSTSSVTGAKLNVSGGSINLSVTNSTLMSTAVTFENTGETATAVDATSATFLATYTGSYGAGGPGAAVIAQTVLSSTFTGGSAPGGVYGGVVVDANGSDPYGTMGVINNGPNVTTPVGAAVWAISRRIAGPEVTLFRATAENDNNTHAGVGLLITSSTALNAVSNGIVITQAVDTGLKIGGVGSVFPTTPIQIDNTSGNSVFKVVSGGTVSTAGIIHVQGFSTPSAGAGVEIGYISGAGFLLSYDRGASAYKPFDFNGSQLTFSVAGGAKMTVVNGLVVGAATGGDKGNGTINIQGAYYADGTAGVTCSGAPTGAFASKNGIVTSC